MKYKLEIIHFRNTNQVFAYKVSTKDSKSMWRPDIKTAYYGRNDFPLHWNEHNNTIIQTIDFDSFDQLRSDYPELFI